MRNEPLPASSPRKAAQNGRPSPVLPSPPGATMRNSTLPKILACAALCAPAAANNFSVNGGGGAIPDCPNAPGTWNVQPTWATLTSTVAVANPVTSITAVKLLGLTHTYRGDV